MAKALTVRHKTISRSSSGVLLWDFAKLSQAVKHGVKYSLFRELTDSIPFNSFDWSAILHLSERTMQRYKTERKTFDPIYSDKILQIAILYKTGTEVFGDKANFDTWLQTKSVALGGVKPKELLDNTFGISLVKDELNRIENGVLA
jgi:putative toxin-antitoxin system antitoxin component (TIGR02293 family)